MKKYLTKQQEEKIIYNYTALNQGLKKAGKEFNVSDKIVKRILVENNIPIRKVGGERKYSIDDNYFNVQSPNMAYIMGLWAADGNVSSSENRLDLELSSQDIEILKQIRTELKSERPIKIYQCGNGYVKNKLLFWSKNIKEVFSNYGIVPNKTYSSEFHAPYNLDKKYWIDYIRGFFDGDGSITKNEYSISFHLNSVNYKFLEDLSVFLKEYYDINTKISTTGMKGRNIPMYRLYCYTEECKKLFDILYTPNSLFLKRKYEKYLELLKWKHLL